MLSNRLSRLFPNRLLPRVRHQTNMAQNDNVLKPSGERTVRDDHLANITVTSFYSQSAIEQLALKQPTRLSPLTMMYISKTEDGSHLLRSAEYLHKDLPIRFAHRINDFRNLPFVVACNPHLLEVHERFIKIFHTLHSFPPIKTLEQEKIYTALLQNTLNCSSDTLPLLTEGFRESKRYIKQDMLVRDFLDRALTARLAIKMLIEHHIELRKEKSNYIGAICMSFSPKELIESSANYVQKACQSTYGRAPNVAVIGHVDVSFPYIPTPLNYIIPEMLKNAFRATVEHHGNSQEDLPEIEVTISVTDDQLILRIRDHGGGMPRSLLNGIFSYDFSSDKSLKLAYTDFENHLYDQLITDKHSNAMSGYGFGVPTSRAYCEYLNGSLTFETLYGIGTDVYIRLGLLTSENRVVRL